MTTRTIDPKGLVVRLFIALDRVRAARAAALAASDSAAGRISCNERQATSAERAFRTQITEAGRDVVPPSPVIVAEGVCVALRFFAGGAVAEKGGDTDSHEEAVPEEGHAAIEGVNEPMKSSTTSEASPER